MRRIDASANWRRGWSCPASLRPFRADSGQPVSPNRVGPANSEHEGGSNLKGSSLNRRHGSTVRLPAINAAAGPIPRPSAGRKRKPWPDARSLLACDLSGACSRRSAASLDMDEAVAHAHDSRPRDRPMSVLEFRTHVRRCFTDLLHCAEDDALFLSIPLEISIGQAVGTGHRVARCNEHVQEVRSVITLHRALARIPESPSAECSFDCAQRPCDLPNRPGDRTVRPIPTPFRQLQEGLVFARS